MHSKKILILLALMFTSVNIGAQTLLNLDFEQRTSDNKVKRWYAAGEGYNIFADTTTFYSGKSSLCIQQTTGKTYAAATMVFPLEDGKGKTVKYSGHIKTENVSIYAGLWWRVDGKNGTITLNNMHDSGPRGTTGWKKYSIEIKIDENATNLVFGTLMAGSGKAWFDDLKIEVNGKIYEQFTQKEIKMTSEQTVWLNSNINVFETANPSHDNSDLGFLKGMIGKAKIVSLGEGTHGTSEFFKMKHRITKYLAQEMGFTVFAIEANMPEAKIVNDYILDGIGDPKKALAGLYFWTWDTQEVLDMIEWMREFNKTGNGKIEFWGFDMQTPDVAIVIVEKFLADHDSSYLSKAKSNYRKILDSFIEIKKMKQVPGNVLMEPFLNYADEVFKYVMSNSSSYKNNIPADEVEWAIQNARIVVQSIECMMKEKTSRDESMAYNVDWILNHFDGEENIVLWAHNGHVSKKENQWYNPMGYYLYKEYAKDMIVFGFGFNEGGYTATGTNGITAYSTSKSQPGSLEWILHNTGKGQCILDLRKITSSPLHVLLKDVIEFRSIGAVAMDDAFYKTKILEEFDAIIYFDKTTPSDCFRATKK